MMRSRIRTHTLEARLEISGVTVQQQRVAFIVSNVAPSVTITQPTAGRSFCTGENVIFRALAGDTDGSVAESGLRWADGAATLGTGSQLAHAFATPGARTVTVTATDNDGATRTDRVNITVSACTNTAPTPGITNPPDAPGSGSDLDVYPSTSDEHGVYLGITLQGTASDAEDGPIPDADMIWTTSRADLQPGGPSSGAQQIGTGRSPSVRLYSSCGYPLYGDHTITLTVTDSAGNSRSMNRMIRVNTVC
ncbi:PKD domain-containing protein [Deinococcus sp.]|uniref:PKD domain-containing protein n=1 Tax=Deinococcus sp. TaxID=47478 RepID=UPI002869D10B|nr:PKD domain-containing protein [Deinococcus sp.]